MIKNESESRQQNCGSCKWHDNWSGVCCHPESKHCADFTSNDDWCRKWRGERKKNEQG